MAMLRDGTIDAAIVDPVPAGPRFATVVADPEATFRAWCERHAARTYNHVVVVRESLADDDAGDARAVRALPGQPGGVPATRSTRRQRRWGSRRSAGSLEVAIAVAGAQGLLARPLAVDDLVTDVLASLQ